jgi:hypothetical protein
MGLINFYKTFDMLVKSWGFDLEGDCQFNFIDKLQQMNDFTKQAYSLINNGSYYNSLGKDMNLNMIYNTYINYFNQILQTPNNYLGLLGGFNANQNSNINLLVNLNANTKIIDNSCNNINIINNIQGASKGGPLKTGKKSVDNFNFINELKNELKNFKDNNKTIEDESTKAKMLNKKRDRESLEDSYTPFSEKTKTRKSTTAAPSYKRSLSYKDFEDQEILLINSIDKPKKKRAKLEVHEKAQLRVDIQNYTTTYETDLQTSLRNPVHGFMKDHFPIMYEIENYYLYIKQISDRRAKIKQLITEIEIVERREESESNNAAQEVAVPTFKKIWDPKILSNYEGMNV